jgi:glycosyltransferase involved in cell wall biosynthesis
MKPTTPSAGPQVTVAIPTRNRAEFLKDCLQSVLDQTLTDIEVFVSDNASTDDTEAVVKSFDDPRVRYSPLKRDVGRYGNLTRCLSLGSAPYVAVLTDDDTMLPENLERKVAILDQIPEVGIVHSAFHHLSILPDGSRKIERGIHKYFPVDTIEPGAAVVNRLLTEAYYITIPAAVIRRSLVQDESYDEQDGSPADLGLSLRIARRTNVAFIPDPLVICCLQPEGGSVSDRVWELHEGEYRPTFASVAFTKHAKLRFLARYGQEFPNLRALRTGVRRYSRSALLYVLGITSRPDRTVREGLRVLSSAARVEPSILLSPRVLRYLAASLVGRRARRLFRAMATRSGVSNPDTNTRNPDPRP